MRRTVELIYDSDCPNVQEARAALLRAFAEAGLQPSWTEWDRRSPASPEHATRYGSPTILVHGRDVAGMEPTAGAESCRIYDHGSGDLRGAPPVARIASALLTGAERPRGRKPMRRGWWRSLAAFPSAGAALVPVCPACWPAYAAILGSLGLGFLFEASYLLPVTAALLGLALAALGFRARSRRGYRPLALGVVAAGAILFFKFVHEAEPLVYAGLVALVGASVWNAWPTRTRLDSSCPRCVGERSPAMTNNPSQENPT